jgi:hypothetical protein
VGDGHRVLVTSLWRAEVATQKVVVVGGLGGWDFTRNQLTPIPNTDVWYRTEQARDDLRTTYRLSPNDPLTELQDIRDDDVRARRIATFQPDPLNSRRFLMNPFAPERQELIYRSSSFRARRPSHTPPSVWACRPVGCRHTPSAAPSFTTSATSKSTPRLPMP